MTLTYNVRWIERTFSSPAVTESLLSQERESGNITYSDYEAAIRFFPGPNRFYRVRLFFLPRFQSAEQLLLFQWAGGIAAIPITFALRRPGWSNLRTYFFMTASSLAGVVVGHTMSIQAHLRFVRSIENPQGFSEALNNIQKTTGGASLLGPVIVRDAKSTFDTDFDAEPPASSSSTLRFLPRVLLMIRVQAHPNPKEHRQILPLQTLQLLQFPPPVNGNRFVQSTPVHRATLRGRQFVKVTKKNVLARIMLLVLIGMKIVLRNRPSSTHSWRRKEISNSTRNTGSSNICRPFVH
jgi:hypothetical protein